MFQIITIVLKMSPLRLCVMFILETLSHDGGIVSNGGVLFILETLSHDGGIVSNGGELFKGRLLLHMEFCCSK